MISRRKFNIPTEYGRYLEVVEALYDKLPLEEKVRIESPIQVEGGNGLGPGLVFQTNRTICRSLNGKEHILDEGLVCKEELDSFQAYLSEFPDDTDFVIHGEFFPRCVYHFAVQLFALRHPDQFPSFDLFHLESLHKHYIGLPNHEDSIEYGVVYGDGPEINFLLGKIKDLPALSYRTRNTLIYKDIIYSR